MDGEPSTTTKEKDLNWKLVFAILAAAFGSAFQHGYNIGVVNAPQKLIEDFIKKVDANRTGVEKNSETKVQLIWSVAVSIYCVGGMIGGSLIGIAANKFGRKKGLLLNNIFVFLSAALLGISKYTSLYELIIFGRFLIGINCGFNAGLAPMYLSEISPIKRRGAVGTVYQLILTISILISQLLGLNSVLGSDNLWPVLLAFIVVPAVVQVIMLPFCPESPTYIQEKKSQEEARKALVWLRGKSDVEEEINEIKTENEQMKLIPKVTVKEMVTNPSLRAPLMIAVVIMIAQQFSGINAAMFFSTKIFKDAKLGERNAQLATLLMGFVNVLMTVVSLLLVEKFGRKTLLLVGFGGMFLVTLLLTLSLALINQFQWLSYFCVVFVNIFVILFAVGPGSIPWFLVNELFNQSARHTACSIAVTTNWTATFFIGLGFLPVQGLIKFYVFLIFAVCQILSFLFIWFYVPETKQKPISEITALFERSRGRTEERPQSTVVS